MNAESNPAVAENAPEPKRLTRYMLWLLVPSLLVYLSGFFLIRLPGFRQWSRSSVGSLLEYGYQLPNRNADIVLFGDSSVLFGINPKQISAELGAKTINLPNTVGSLPVTNDLPLRRYLATNRPPRLIVFYFSAWNMDYLHEPENPYTYEGQEMLLRHGTAHEVLDFARHNTLTFLLFPFNFFRVDTATLVQKFILHHHVPTEDAVLEGHKDINLATLSDSCALPETLLHHSSANTVVSLANTYRTPQTKVLVVIAPLPGCSNATVLADRTYSGLTAAAPKIMSPTKFVMDGFYTHFVAPSVPEGTENLVEAIRPVLQGRSSASAR
jgi:hypothetical protein